jgi:hypothetical protein
MVYGDPDPYLMLIRMRIQLDTLARIRIQIPKMMRIRISTTKAK